MILTADALDWVEARDRARRFAVAGVPPVEGYPHVAWLAIEPRPSPLRTWPQETQLLLTIPDQTAPQDWPPYWSGLRADPRAEYPTEEQARTVLRFLRALRRSDRAWALLVHCTAGVSRSTAVVKYVRGQLGIDGARPRREEGHWNPNRTLLRLLSETAEEGPGSPP
jgi:nucleotide-binding universal stress UspA family protein